MNELIIANPTYDFPSWYVPVAVGILVVLSIARRMADKNRKCLERIDRIKNDSVFEGIASEKLWDKYIEKPPYVASFERRELEAA